MIKVSTLLLTLLMSLSAFGFTPLELWETWPESRFEKTVAPCLRHDHLMKSLQVLQSRYPDAIRLEEAGKSVQGRSIQLLSIGQGRQYILLWSQMHGDEPSATPALLDIAAYLAEHADDPAVQLILNNFTLLMIPMLNPDGTEIYARRNAQAIDINRDALILATPEGRVLKRVRDQYEPMLGFNLHDQNRRTAVGDSGHVAINAVLAVSGDAANTLTPGRQRTKRASAAIVEALAPIMPGGMARYDEDWSPRAFGDNLTAWGTPVVLIESGGLPPGQAFSQLTRLNFVAILSVLQDLARDDLASYDPQVYEDLLRNRSGSWSDVVVRGAYMLQPGMSEPYRADLAFDQLRSDQQLAGCPSAVSANDSGVRAPSSRKTSSRIFMVGDASFHGAGKSIDAHDSLLLAPFDVGAKGWPAHEWLDSAGLSRLTNLGVGTLYWSVSLQHRQAALDHTRQLAKQGDTRIEVLTSPAGLPGLVLSGPPPAAASTLLSDILTALGAGDINSLEGLQALWMGGSGTSSGRPRLHKGRPASFLLLAPAPAGSIDFNRTSLMSVWLDGQK